MPFTLRARLRSFRHALAGVADLVRTEHNARVHLGASIAVVASGFALDVSRVEWCLLLLAMVSVWVAEALNAALEALADVASPGFHMTVKRAKDIAAGAVLISAIGAALVGGLILLPRMLAGE